MRIGGCWATFPASRCRMNSCHNREIASGRRRFAKFDPEAAFRLMADQGVRNAFIPPTALRLLRSINNPRKRFDLALRTLASGGEALGAETFAWGHETLGLSINEFYGQTECNL